MFLASQFTAREFASDMACKGNADKVDRPRRRAMLINNAAFAALF
jgi:hypothetical protein